jgi:hypothetical protein
VLNGFSDDEQSARLTILGPNDLAIRGNTLPFVVAFREDDAWYPVPPALVGQMLEDFTGVITRSGCNCAGPYAFKLNDLEGPAGDRMVAFMTSGTCPTKQMIRPGWTRATLGALLSQHEVDYFIWAWKWLVTNLRTVMSHYRYDEAHNSYTLREPVRIVRSIAVSCPDQDPPSRLGRFLIFDRRTTFLMEAVQAQLMGRSVVTPTGDNSVAAKIIKTVEAYQRMSPP